MFEPRLQMAPSRRTNQLGEYLQSELFYIAYLRMGRCAQGIQSTGLVAALAGPAMLRLPRRGDRPMPTLQPLDAVRERNPVPAHDIFQSIAQLPRNAQRRDGTVSYFEPQFRKLWVVNGNFDDVSSR